MPPKKNKRKIKLKQLKIIQSRLMEISIKIDHYIYKHKPIPLQDAQLYIQEVSSYKYQCEDNARVLQVIEKLKHQLKDVIKEAQESTDSYNVLEIVENSINTCLMSPTYSIDQEDRDYEDFVTGGKDLHIGDNIILQKDNDAIDPQAEIIDLCNDDDIATNHKKICTDIKNINRSFSELQIKTDMQAKQNEIRTAPEEVNDIIPYTTIVQDQKCEKNNPMLKNTFQNEADPKIYCNRKHQYQDMSETNNSKSLNNEVISNNSTYALGNRRNIISTQNLLIERCRNEPKHVELHSTKDMPKKRPSIKLSKPQFQGKEIIETDKDNLIASHIVHSQGISKNSTAPCKPEKKNFVPSIPKKNQHGKKTKRMEKKEDVKEINKKRSKNKSSKSQTQQHSDKTGKNTDLINDKNFIKTPSIAKTSDNSKIPTGTVSYSHITFKTVYNNNVENDLSWIENIRYIREVAPDEIDPKLTYLDDSFWGTFDLPANWNDQDFIY